MVEITVKKPVLGYWKIRCLAMRIKYLLAYLDVEYQDVTYQPDPVTGSRACWFDVKHKLGSPFPNLPYFIDECNGEEVNLTETAAILKYITAKHRPELAGTTPA